MSELRPVPFKCHRCGCTSTANIFRSISGEEACNKKLVFTNKVNRVKCTRCGASAFLAYPLMYVDHAERFAVWFEPMADSTIDADNDRYRQVAQVMPASSYLCTAPRVRDWTEFKKTIVQFYGGQLTNEAQRAPAPEYTIQDVQKMMGVLAQPRKKPPSGCAALCLSFFVLAAALTSWLLCWLSP